MFTNNAEGGVDGNTVATTDTGSGDAWTLVNKAADGIVEYENLPFGGWLGYRVASRTTASPTYLAWTHSAMAEAYGRFYMRRDVDDLSGGPSFFQLRETAGGNITGTLWHSGTETLRILDPTAAIIWEGTIRLLVNTWYRIEWYCKPNGATSDWRVRLFLGNSLLEDSGLKVGTNGASHTTVQQMRIGIPVHGSVADMPSSTGYLYFDDIVAFATDWVGVAASTTDVPVAHFGMGMGRW